MRSSRREFLQAIGVSSAFISARETFPFFNSLANPGDKVSAARLAADPLRPQFHLLPARNWMNDPNGPLFWRGQYHMFFQYNPNAAVWGDMHWAHAVSPDMIHWKHLPVALTPTPGGYDQDGCFSGSAVIYNGTPTFLYTAVKSVQPLEATLRDGTHNFLETQCLATSNDLELKSWTKLPAPVLFPPKDPKLTGFRDPFLWQHSEDWYMGVGSGQRGDGGRVLLYQSKDLRNWAYLYPLASGIGNGKQASDPVDTAEMWECPDFFSLGSKFVLLYSTERKVYWQTGELDSKEMRFHAEKQGLLDSGAFYAPKSQLDADGRRILWAWIPETRPEAEFSAAGWAGCMSLPRILSLRSDNSLAMRVIDELAQLRLQEISLPGRETAPSARLEALRKIQLKDAAAEFQLRFKSQTFRLDLTDGKNSIISLSFDPARTNREFQLGSQFAPVQASVPPTPSGDHQLRLFLDASVLECFIDETAALTARVYSPNNQNIRIAIPESDLDAITSLFIWPLRPISPDRLTS
jgi:beta-fructofuranosidase